MRKLESMIAEFVGDLLRTIGEATVEDLRELFEGRPESEKLSEVPAHLASLATSATSSPPGRPLLSPRGVRSEERAHPSALRRSAVLLSTTVSGPFAPPGVAEITDPESLLSLGAPKGPAGSSAALLPGGLLADVGDSAPLDVPIRTVTRPRAQALLEVREPATALDGHTGRPTEVDMESPDSGIRPLGGATVKLSDNETLARVSNSGVVIRRRKRA
jgi:hypothetical protein